MTSLLPPPPPPPPQVIFFIESRIHVHNTLLACLIRATVIPWFFKRLAQIYFPPPPPLPRLGIPLNAVLGDSDI